MERIVLTPEEQTTVDEFKSTYPYFDEDGLIYEGSNLVVDDHLRIDDAWEGVVLGGETGLVWFFVPAWGLTLPIDLVPYVTDRIGPTGAVMPIFDEIVVNPQCLEAVSSAKKTSVPRRPFKEALRDALPRLTPKEERRALKALKKVLEKKKGPC